MDFVTLAQQCAPNVHHQTLTAIVRQESGFNPYAIGVVGGRLVRQPVTKDEAIATAKALEAAGWNYSVGLSQVNRYNLAKYDLNLDRAFEPCENLRAGAAILTECFVRALKRHKQDEQGAVRSALSCYYSGNFTTGYSTGYVQSVIQHAALPARNVRYVDAVNGQPLPAPTSGKRQ